MSDWQIGTDAEAEDYAIRCRMAEAEEELSFLALCELEGERAWEHPEARQTQAQETNMPSINDVYGGKKGLKAEDLRGRSHLLTIDESRLMKFNDGSKIVLHFKGKEKELVCNKTNAQMIASKYGDDYEEWAGAEVELYPDKTQFNGELVDCIRIRFPIPAATGSEDEIPF